MERVGILVLLLVTARELKENCFVVCVDDEDYYYTTWQSFLWAGSGQEIKVRQALAQLGSIMTAPTCQMPLVMACIDHFFTQYHTVSTVGAMCRISREFINCAIPVASGCGEQTRLLFKQTSEAMGRARCSI